MGWLSPQRLLAAVAIITHLRQPFQLRTLRTQSFALRSTLLPCLPTIKSAWMCLPRQQSPNHCSTSHIGLSHKAHLKLKQAGKRFATASQAKWQGQPASILPLRQLPGCAALLHACLQTAAGFLFCAAAALPQSCRSVPLPGLPGRSLTSARRWIRAVKTGLTRHWARRPPRSWLQQG